MAITNIDSIELRDISTDNKKAFALYIDGCRRGFVSKKPGRPTEFHWEVFGPFVWREAKVLLHGLLQLSVIAERIDEED